MIHSGGDSKRIPQYSAFGKLFSKVPRELPDGRYSTLFDEFLISLSGLPSRMKDGVLIASGDVLLLYNYNQIDFGRQGAVGISMKVPAAVGTHHGVYASGKDDKVRKFLHKVSLDTLQREGAVNTNGSVNVDSGLIGMDGELTYKMVNLIMAHEELDMAKYNQFINDKVRLNFYGDFLLPLTSEADFNDYLKEPSEGSYCTELIEARKAIWHICRSHALYVQALAPSQFIHFGITAEFRDLINETENEYKYLSWQRKTVSYSEENKNLSKWSSINSYIGKNVRIGEDVLLEDSKVSSVCIGAGTVLSNIELDLDVRIPENVVFHQLPVIKSSGNKGFVTRVYGVYDNPKDEVELGKATFLNQDFNGLLKLQGISEKEVWKDGQSKSLWNAQLYPLCLEKESSLYFAMLLCRFGEVTKEELAEWLSMPRVSLKESYELADQAEIIAQQNRLEDEIRIKIFISNLRKRNYVKDTYGILGNNAEQILRRIQLVVAEVESFTDSIERSRFYRCAAEVVKGIQSTVSANQYRELEDRCFDEMNGAIQRSTIKPLSFENLLNKMESFEYVAADVVEKNETKKEAVIEAPARVNFGGGWSDTPPYSIENGGTVLNAAISLKGKLPIKVHAKLLYEKVIRFNSKDLSITASYTSLEELQNFNDPTDPLALHKAALVVTGVIPTRGSLPAGIELKDILTKIGGGISLSTEVDIPKGSGLGTSCILAGSVLKSIHEILGLEYDDQKIFDEVLCLEQLLTTGGGWQDQVGGLVPGIKLVTSKPGLPQKIEITQLKLSSNTLKELQERFLLVYTGQRRLAKGILRDIMGEYILNNPLMVDCLNRIQKLAVLMKYELEKGNVDGFAKLLEEHWTVSKTLDGGCTNSYIDQIIEICRPYVSGVMICGAGGGGFLQMLLKNGADKEKLRKVLEDVFQDNHVGIWDCEIVASYV